MVDFNKKIKNSDKFREPAITFQKTGKYCNFTIGTSEYYTYWDEQKRRCIEGYTAEDGDWISGYNYFYLNFCPISRIVNKEVNGKIKRINEIEFPDFWDYDYYYFQSVEEAEQQGKHLCVLKARRRGYSFKGGAMLCRNYYLIPNSKSFVYAGNKQYLTEDGILTKAWDYMNFIDKHTAWGKKRSVNTSMRKRAGFFTKDEFGNEIELGYKSEIQGVTLKDNASVVRGKKANLILFEEGGSMPELGAAWQIARPSVEVDGIAFAPMIVWGCVCAGTKVYTNNGDYINVEDLKPEDGIVGWDTYQAVPQTISAMNKPTYKPCLRITTETGRILECSTDHPILWSTPSKTTKIKDLNGNTDYKKQWLWHEAEKCKVGDQVGVIDSVPFFGDKEMWEPRLVGWLIGDGSYGYNRTPRLSNCDSEILNYVESNFDTATERERLTKDGKQYKEVRIKGICCKLRELGIYGQTKDKKRLPIDINKYSVHSLSELLGGLFDTDGYVSISKTGQVRLTLSQSHEIILRQVQQILLKFGIHSRVRHIKPTGREHVVRDRIIKDLHGEWRLEISDITSVSRFAKNIELKVKYKDAALDLIWLYTANHHAKHQKYISGVRAERITEIKDIGKQLIYNLTAKQQHNYLANGIITHNTGGDDDSRFATLKDMFYHPEGYNCLSFDNIWDEGAQGQKCGFFAPQYSNMDIRDDKGNRLYMDEDGNTLTKTSIEYVLAERRKVIENATNNASIDRYVAERPITPAEAMLEFGGNIFPKKELQEHLARIRTNKALQNHKQVGDLVFDENGQIKWIPKKTGDITHYPLNKDDDPTGSIVIWEHPMQDAPVGLYILGVDPYDHDQSGTNSLGSTFVYKRFQGFESYYDIIVAEYTGRPASAEEYYENLRKLAIYYNGRIMYENERKGLFPYFTAKHCDYLLADQPDIISDVVGNSKVQRKKGCHMNKQIKQWGEGLIKDWLNEEQSPGKKNLYNILSEPLLQELIAYNDTGNFDRCLTKGTLVTTINGDKPVEEIDRTDKVLTHTGKYQNVTWTDKHVHNGNIVVLKCTGDYQELKCTDNHPILVKYTNYKKHKFRNLDYLNEDFLRADKLTNKYQFTLLPKRKLNNKLNISKRFLYLMGWMLSDGYCSPKSNEVKITFQKNQLECLKQCEQIIYEFDNSARCVIKEEKGCYRLITYNKQLHDYAIRFGCQVNNKKLAYDVYNNYSDLMPFVLGVLEGDGYQKLNANYDGYTRNCIEFSTVYEELLRQCRQILIDNGIYSSIRKIKSRNNRKTQYGLLISGEYVKKLLSYYTWDDDYNYEPIYSYKFVMPSINKNTSRVLEDEHGFWVPIKLLYTYATTETVYNFEVQEDHTYVANGVLTHNCMALMQVMIYREQLYNVKVKEKEKDNKNRLLFDGPIFAQDWFDDKPIQSSDDNVYTF